MDKRDRLILLFTLLMIAAIISVDLITDSREGVVLWHLLTEGAGGLLALGAAFYLLKDMIQLKNNLNKERHTSATFKEEADRWRTQSKNYIEGLSVMIDAQLSAWNLTPAEREVAFLLLKGMSLKEVALLRGTSEKTARVQSMSVYAKAGLTSRSELSAFFLEDLLSATQVK